LFHRLVLTYRQAADVAIISGPPTKSGKNREEKINCLWNSKLSDSDNTTVFKG